MEELKDINKEIDPNPNHPVCNWYIEKGHHKGGGHYHTDCNCIVYLNEEEANLFVCFCGLPVLKHEPED